MKSSDHPTDSSASVEAMLQSCVVADESQDI